MTSNSATNLANASMLFPNNKGQTSSYNWVGVLEFLQDQYRTLTYKETEWLLEKQELQAKLNQYEGEIKAQESINKDLIKRIKMLEFSLRQERIKYSRNGNPISSKTSSDLITQILKENQEAGKDLSSSFSSAFPGVPKRRAKGYRPLLTKFLEEVGFEDIFTSLTETNEHHSTHSFAKTNFTANTIIPNKESNSEFGGQQNNIMGSGAMFNTGEKYYNRTGDEPGKAHNTSGTFTHQGKKANLQNSFNGSNPDMLDLPEDKNRKNDKADKVGLSERDKLPSHQKTESMNEYRKKQKENILEDIPLKHQLRSHLDGVRSLFFCNKEQVLASVSEDCMVKLWDLQQLKNPEVPQVDPFYTFREHTGPLFAITGTQSEDFEDDDFPSLIFTAGSEGIIKSWVVPSPQELDSYGPTEAKNYCLGSWQCHDEAIWQLSFNSFEKLLLSSSSDGFIKIWRISEELGANLTVRGYNASQINAFSYKPAASHPIDTPTSISWLYSEMNLIAAAFSNTQGVVLFDREQNKPVSLLRYTAETHLHQANKIISHPNMQLLISGHEDSFIRFFDLNSNKAIKAFAGHCDSVTSVSLHSNKFLICSSSHDGTIKLWDIRKYEVLSEIEAHTQKFDERIHTALFYPPMNYLASAGADGLINIYSI